MSAACEDLEEAAGSERGQQREGKITAKGSEATASPPIPNGRAAQAAGAVLTLGWGSWS